MHAAFSRHDIPESERNPFMLYVDEFHTFSTTAFAGMLSEVRKYGLGLILAHQHIQQTEQDVFEAIMGNAGSLLVFRLGVLDAPAFAKQLEDVSTYDLVNLPNYQGFAKLMVDGVKSKAFSFKSAPPII